MPQRQSDEAPQREVQVEQDEERNGDDVGQRCPARGETVEEAAADTDDENQNGKTDDRRVAPDRQLRAPQRSEEHTSELQSLMRISDAVLCLKNTHTPPLYN